MGRDAWLECAPRCPECGEVLTDLAWVGWGGVHSPSSSYGPVYRVGDRVMWCLDAEGAVVDHREIEGCRSVNYGRPTRHRVTVFEGRVLYGQDKCAKCGAVIGLLAIEIVGNRIVGTRFVPGVAKEWRERVWYRVDDIETGELLDYDFYW